MAAPVELNQQLKENPMSHEFRAKLSAQRFALSASTGTFFDLNAFLLADNGKVRDPYDLIWCMMADHIDYLTGYFTYAIQSRGNKLYFAFDRVPPDIKKIVIVLSRFPGRHTKFVAENSDVNYRLEEWSKDSAGGLFTFTVPMSPTETSTVTVCEFTRAENEWEVHTVATRSQGGMKERCIEYGVPIIELK